jgi:hypothetical protein
MSGRLMTERRVSHVGLLWSAGDGYDDGGLLGTNKSTLADRPFCSRSTRGRQPAGGYCSSHFWLADCLDQAVVL